MRASATGYDPDDAACPKRFLLEMLQAEWPGLALTHAIDPDADVLLVLLDRASGPRLFAHEMPSPHTLVIGVVLELHRTTAPLLKLFDLVVYANALQRRVVESLLGLSYASLIMPLPSGTFMAPTTTTRGDCLVWIDEPFDPVRGDDYLARARQAVAWHPAETRDFVLAVDVPPRHAQAFAAWSAVLHAQDPRPATSRSVLARLTTRARTRLADLARGRPPAPPSRFVALDRRGLPVPALRARLARCTGAQFFSDALAHDQLDALLAAGDAALIDNALVERPFLADLALARVPMAPVVEVSAHNYTAGLATTYRAFAHALRDHAATQRDDVLARKHTRFAATPSDALADLDVVHGAPLANAFVVSICYRDQAAKIARCLASVAACAARSGRDVGVAIVDDASADGSLDVVRDFLARHPALPACVVANRERRFAARNFHNVIHLLTTNDASIVLELDGDDFLATDHVLEHLADAYATGAELTRGSYRVHPLEQSDFSLADVRAAHAALDFAEPWSLARCTAWLHLRSARRGILRRIEREHFLDRRTGTWLAARHDTAIQPRAIELARGRCATIHEALYAYDVSGGAHDHAGDDANAERLRLFADLDRIWHTVLL